MTSTDLLILADRVEGLSGPCRETDGLIYLALRPAWNRARVVSVGSGDRQDTGDLVILRETIDDHFRTIADFPAYTASLDSAASLVPEGCLFTVRTLWDGPTATGYAVVSRYEENPKKTGFRRFWIGEREGNAATPALALVAACLRTIAANQEPSA